MILFSTFLASLSMWHFLKSKKYIFYDFDLLYEFKISISRYLIQFKSLILLIQVYSDYDNDIFLVKAIKPKLREAKKFKWYLFNPPPIEFHIHFDWPLITKTTNQDIKKLTYRFHRIVILLIGVLQARCSQSESPHSLQIVRGDWQA